jgi:hypothetical protein
MNLLLELPARLTGRTGFSSEGLTYVGLSFFIAPLHRLRVTIRVHEEVE